MAMHVLYHGNCFDGFGAAWAAWRKLGDCGTYIPVTYGNPLPEIPADEPVVIADFSYPRDVLLKLKTEHELHVLDHHATAREALEGLEFCKFDLEHSGAYLAWEFFHPGEEVPKLIQYLEDRDLWRFNLKGSRAISAVIRSYPYTFDAYEWLSTRFGRQDDFYNLVAEGEALLRLEKQQVQMICDQAFWQEIDHHLVPIVNATTMFSEVAEELCKRYPEAEFAAYYVDRSDGFRQFGLRSRNSFDVSQVAKNLGGGGHHAAAGFQLRIGRAPISRDYS